MTFRGKATPQRSPIAEGKPATRQLRVAVDGRVMQDRYHGIGRHTYEVVRRLAERELDLVVLWDPSSVGRLDVAELGTHSSVTLLELPRPVTSPLQQITWPRFLAAVAPDVLVSPYHLSSPWLHCGVATITFVHDCIFEANPSFAPGSARFLRLYRAATWLALVRSTTVATVSHATKREIECIYGIALDDNSVISHGVGEQFLGITWTPRRDNRYILHVGVHRPHKNHEILIRAFAELAQVMPDVRLVLVGSSDERFAVDVAGMVRSCGVEDRVDMRSVVADDELLDLYRHASVFAFPSIVEGFGLPVLEAMAAGVPTVTSDAAAVVEASGGASVVVPALDCKAWAAALRRVVADPDVANDLSRSGRRVAEESTWDRSADRTLQLLEDCHRTFRLRGRS